MYRALWALLLGLVLAAPCVAAPNESVWSVRLAGPPVFGPGVWERDGIVYAGAFLHQEEAQSLAAAFAGAAAVFLPAPQTHEWRPWRQRITLASLGWDAPRVAQGVDPFFTLRLPWLEGAEARGSRMVLQLHFPPGLRAPSRVEVWAKGMPLLAAPVRGEAMSLEVPLDPLAALPQGEVVELQVRGTLSITEDRCLDAQSGALWMRIDPSSALDVVRTTPARTVRGAVLEAAVLGARLTQRTNGRQYLEAVCRLAAALGQLAWRDDVVELAAGPGFGPSIVVADIPQDILWTGSTLYLSPQGAQLIASQWAPALLTRGAHEVNAAQPPSALPPATIPLASLGQTGATVRGQGDLVIPVRLDVAQLGAWPRALIAGLSFSHSAVPEKDQAAVILRLNGHVLESQELRGSASRRLLRVEIPGRLLHGANLLEVVFRYTPQTGACAGPSQPVLEASLLGDSFVEVQGELPAPPLSLASFAAQALGDGVVVSSKDHAQYTPNLVALCQALGRQNPTALHLHMATPQDASHGGFVLTDDLSLPGITPVALPLEPTEIRNPLTGAVLARFTPEDPPSLAQTFRDPQGRPVLAVSGPALLPQRLASLLQNAGGANLMIARDDLWQFLEIGDKFALVQPAAKGVLWYLARYRLILFGVLGALFLAGLIILYLRAGRRPHA